MKSICEMTRISKDIDKKFNHKIDEIKKEIKEEKERIIFSQVKKKRFQITKESYLCIRNYSEKINKDKTQFDDGYQSLNVIFEKAMLKKINDTENKYNIELKYAKLDKTRDIKSDGFNAKTSRSLYVFVLNEIHDKLRGICVLLDMSICDLVSESIIEYCNME